MNAIFGENDKIYKRNISEVNSSLNWVWKKLFEAKVINQGVPIPEEHVGHYCEFHGEDGHAIQDCYEFRAKVQSLMGNEDLLIITADHGCDPAHTGSDHTREYVPILCHKKGMQKLNHLGTRETFADTAATICHYFGLAERFGAQSYLDQLEG